MLEIYFDGILIDADHYQSLSEKWVMFDKSFKLGSTLAREFTLVVPKSVFPVVTDEVLIKYMGDDYAHLIVENYKFSEGGALPTVTLTLVDRMVLANFDYDYSDLTPCTTKTILLDICSEMGVELGNTGFINDDIMVDYWDNRVTARTYLGYIAELNGGFARIEQDGKLWLRSFKELTPQVINPELCENIIIGTPHKIDRVVFDNGLLIYSTSNDLELETLYLDGQNVFINDEATFNKIVPRIKDFEYYNINTGSTYVLPTVMVGDVLTLTLDGVTYPTIAQFNEISFMGLWHGSYELNLESQVQQETQVLSTEEKFKRINVTLDRNKNELTLEVSAIKDNTYSKSEVDGIVEEIELSEGKSAYEIALENGFVGTEQDWLDSLHGVKGEDGETTYTWVKYADTPTSGMDDDSDGKKYIGMAFNKPTQTKSENYGDYQWSLMPQNITTEGRNYVLKSDEVVLLDSDISEHTYDLSEPYEANVDYTISVEFEPTSSLQSVFLHIDGLPVKTFNKSPTTNLTSWTGKTSNGGATSVRIERISSTAQINKIWITKSNHQMGWSLAPEDVDSKLVDLEETVTTEYNTAITIAEQSITSNVSETYTTKTELGEYQSSVETRFTQTNEEYEFSFNSINQQLSDNAQLTQEEFDEISKYITFRDGKIYLGETNNLLSMIIQNDRLSFLYANTEVAYVSNHRLYITDGYFINSLRVGQFAFEPRANGSLSFGKASPIPNEVNVVFGGELDGTDYKPFQGGSYYDAVDSQLKVPPGSQWTIWFVSFHHTSELPIVINQAILRDKVTGAEYYAEETPFIGYNNTMLNVIGQNIGTVSYAGCLVFFIFEGGGFFLANPVEIKFRISGETEYRTADITEQWGIG